MNSTKFLRQYAFAGKTLTKIELDPDHQLIDIDRTNNTWNSP